METYDARALAKALMGEHGLVDEGWTLTLDINAGRLYGQCRFSDKRIRLNPEFIRRNDEVFLGLTQPQLISVAMIVVGAAWIAVRARRGDLWAPAAPEDSAAQRA